MYIVCKNCNTNFIVLDDQISPNGRKVKCSKCDEIWFHKIDKLNNKPYVVPSKTEHILFQPFDPGVNLPAPIIYEQKTYNLFTLILVIIIILLANLLFYF